MVDMGETNNISLICKEEKRVELATHAYIHFVFHGIPGLGEF